MKISKFLLGALLPLAMLLTGCYKDDINDLKKGQKGIEERLAALEAWQTAVNSNIAVLQELITALNDKDYVTGVTNLKEGGVTVGYVISFTKSSPVTIYHGAKGETGNTPVIGVQLHTDGKYYWTQKAGTASATWILDATGNKICAEGKTAYELACSKGYTGTLEEWMASLQGDSAYATAVKNGYTGTQAEWLAALQGRDAVAPMLRINDAGVWEISTNGGVDWSSTGIKAQGEDGDSIFSNIDTSNEDYVEFTLADGTTTLQLPKYKGLKITLADTEDLYFLDGETTYTVSYTITGGDAKNVVTASFEGGGADDYTLKVTRTNASSGTIKITMRAGSAMADRVIVTVHNGSASYTDVFEIGFDEWYDQANNTLYTRAGNLTTHMVGHTTETTSPATLKIVGRLNDADFATLKAMASSEAGTGLADLDMGGARAASIPADAFRNKASLTSIVLPQGITSIGNYAFAWCSGFTGSLTIPAGVTSIGEGAFASCRGLTGSLTIPDGVTSIGGGAFSSCSGFDGSLTIPDGVTSIGMNAFGGCTGLTGSLTIPAGVAWIGDWAFLNCTGFTGSLTIPAGVTSIGISAFESCSGFTTVTAHPTVAPTLGMNAFSSFGADGGSTPLFVPSGATGYGAGGWGYFINRQTIQ